MKKLFALILLASPAVFAEMPACSQYEAQVSVEIRSITEQGDSCLVQFGIDLRKPEHAFNSSSVCPLMLEDVLFTGFLVKRVENTPMELPNCGLAIGDLLGGVLVRKDGDTLATIDLGLE